MPCREAERNLKFIKWLLDNLILSESWSGGKNMRTMICDDEKSTCAELEQILINYSSERGVRLEVDVFFSGDSMI